MSPESVNGVAEIVYTPFADESSRWLIVLALLRFAVCENAVKTNVYLA
jgi:hypothetical protein